MIEDHHAGLMILGAVTSTQLLVAILAIVSWPFAPVPMRRDWVWLIMPMVLIVFRRMLAILRTNCVFTNPVWENITLFFISGFLIVFFIRVIRKGNGRKGG